MSPFRHCMCNMVNTKRERVCQCRAGESSAAVPGSEQVQGSSQGQASMKLGVKAVLQAHLTTRSQSGRSSRQALPACAISRVYFPSLKLCKTLCCSVGVPGGRMAGRHTPLIGLSLLARRSKSLHSSLNVDTINRIGTCQL